MSPPLTYYEFFAGGGMARAGLGEAWTCAFANDFDAGKAAAYADNWGDDHLHVGDVWKIDPAALPGRADLAWASSPCQDVSLAGRRAGLSGARSSAFWGFWRLVEALDREGRAPRTVILENVVGLLTSHGGQDFSALCEAIAQRRYYLGAVEIDASLFVPQSRPRMFLIASKIKPPARLTAIEPTLPFHTDRVRRAFHALPTHLKRDWIWWNLDTPLPRNQSISAILENDPHVTWHTALQTAQILKYLAPLHDDKLRRAKEVGEPVVGTLYRRMRTEQQKKVQRSELRFDGTAGCLRTPGGGSSRQFVVAVNGSSVKTRQLTAREGARLMGLGDSYKLPRASTRAHHIIGDGVVVPVVQWLADRILMPLLQKAELADANDQRTQRRRAGTGGV